MGADGRDIGLGDLVDVPGGMHGVVKFVGSIHGKKGVFAGVDLSREYAARGKNDGTVDGYAHVGPAAFAPLLIAVQHTILSHVDSRLWDIPAHTARTETRLSGLVRFPYLTGHALVQPQLQPLDHGEAQLQPRHPFDSQA